MSEAEDTVATPVATPETPARLAKKLATLLAGEAVVSLAASFLAKTSLLALVVETIVAEFATSRVGVEWQRPEQPAWRSVGKGVVFGLGLAALVMTASLAANHGEIVMNRPALAALGVALVSAVLVAVRDELLLRGGPLRLVLAASPATTSPVWTSVRMIFVGTAVGAAHAASEGASAREVVVAAALATIFASLWRVDGSALRPVAAHAAFAFAESGLVGSGAVDLRGVVLGQSVALPAFHGAIGASVLVFAAIAAAIVAVRTPRPLAARSG